MDLNDASVKAGDFLRRWMFGNKDAGQPLKVTPKPNNVSANVSTPKPNAKPPSAKGLGKGFPGKAFGALNVWDVVRPGVPLTGRIEAGSYLAAPILTGLALNVTGSEDRTTKWRRLGYESPEAYEKAMQNYEASTGKSAETGKAPQRPKASGTVITVDGKRYDTGYHAEEIAELRKKYPGGGNAGQAQSLDPNKSSYIPPTGKPLSVPTAPVPPSDPAPPTVTTPDTTRTNQSGIQQQGKKLSSSDLASLGILDAARFWEGGTHVSGGDTPPSGPKTVNVGGEDVELSGDALIEHEEAGTEKDSTGLVPQATEGKPTAPGTPWSNVELTEEDEKYVSPIYQNAARNAARSAFLDAPAGKGAMGAINARNRAVGGDDAHGFNVGGKHYQWADGVDQKQRTEAMYQLSGGAGNTKEGFDEFAQQFLKDYMQKPEVVDTQEDGAGLVGHGDFHGYSSPTVSTPRKGPAITTDEDETAEFTYNKSKPTISRQRSSQEIPFN